MQKCFSGKFQKLRKLVLLFTVVIWFSCTQNKTGAVDSPKQVVVGVIPSEEAERMVKNMEPAIEFLRQELEIPVKMYRASDYTAIIEGMRGEKVDIGVFGPFSYVLASGKAGAEPLVVPGKRTGEPAKYNSLLITHRDTGLESIEDLKHTKKKYTLSFSDPASTSGHLVPRGQLHTLGIDPERHFKEILFSGNHTATILALASNKVDVAGCSYTVYRKMIERGMLKEDDVKILWKSKPLPVDLVTVRKGLSEQFKAKLLDIYLRLAEEVPASAGYFYEEWNDSTLVFLPAHDSLYADIRQLSKYIHETKHD